MLRQAHNLTMDENKTPSMTEVTLACPQVDGCRPPGNIGRVQRPKGPRCQSHKVCTSGAILYNKVNKTGLMSSLL